MPCERGKVVITMHLRQRSYFTFSCYYLDHQGSQQDSSKVVHGKLVCVARAVTLMVKSGAKALENIALRIGADFVGDVLGGS